MIECVAFGFGVFAGAAFVVVVRAKRDKQSYWHTLKYLVGME